MIMNEHVLGIFQLLHILKRYRIFVRTISYSLHFYMVFNSFIIIKSRVLISFLYFLIKCTKFQRYFSVRKMAISAENVFKP